MSMVGNVCVCVCTTHAAVYPCFVGLLYLQLSISACTLQPPIACQHSSKGLPHPQLFALRALHSSACLYHPVNIASYSVPSCAFHRPKLVDVQDKGKGKVSYVLSTRSRWQGRQQLPTSCLTCHAAPPAPRSFQPAAITVSVLHALLPQAGTGNQLLRPPMSHWSYAPSSP